jgi:hypothetical protein
MCFGFVYLIQICFYTLWKSAFSAEPAPVDNISTCVKFGLMYNQSYLKVTCISECIRIACCFTGLTFE